MTQARALAEEAKKASRILRTLKTEEKNKVLGDLSRLLLEKENEILDANQKDLRLGKEKNLSSALMDRLLLDSKRLAGIRESLVAIQNLPDPVWQVTRGLTLPNGLELVTKRVPLGVVMTIYESRPNVTIDVAALSFKSGNACILRGGSEAFQSNLILSSLFGEALLQNHLPASGVSFVPVTDRESMKDYFVLEDCIDLVVPRGGEALIRFVTEHSKIPVVKHDKGVTNLYLDKEANREIVLPILLNSKLQRTGVCNALENLIIHRDYPDTKALLHALEEKGVELLLPSELLPEFPKSVLAKEEDYSTEFLDPRLSVALVSDLSMAISFIQKYGSGHTECILSENAATIQAFTSSLDSAAIFVNCSTRFHDGGELQLGAEVGISTGKLHVRGTMGLEHLTTTTTFLYGKGQIRR